MTDSAGQSKPDEQVVPIVENDSVIVENDSVIQTKSLLFVLATPPETSGLRTTARIEMACEILGFSSAAVVNLFPIATRSVIDITVLGTERDTWVSNHGDLKKALENSSEVVLAYGLAEPSGPAKLHHRSQVQWVKEQISSLGIPTWMVGGRPSHPSRWQRYTYRAYPDLPFREALEHSLQLG